MSMTAIILLILKASIILSVFAIGLRATFADATFMFRRPGLLVRALLAMNVLMPLTALGLAAAIAATGAARAPLLPHLLASLGYVHNIVYGVPSTINVVAWSLEIEVQFYILAPALAFAAAAVAALGALTATRSIPERHRTGRRTGTQSASSDAA